jgi:hypothetical protein
LQSSSYKSGWIRRPLLPALAVASLISLSGYALASGWAPFARDDRATVYRGGTVTVLDGGASSVLANDFDIEGDAMTATLTKDVKHGQLEFRKNGTFVYVHNGNNKKDDEFRYQASDGTGLSRETKVRIRIENVPNNPPFVTGTPSNQEVVEGTFFQIAMAPYFGDLDDGDVLRYSVSGLPRTFDINRDSGVLSGTPRTSDARDAPYTVRVTATDSGGLSASLEFLLTVRADTRADLKVSAVLSVNPITVGETSQWRVSVENLGPVDLDDGELVVEWLTSGPVLSVDVPEECVLSDNDSRNPSLRCSLDGLAARTVRSFDLRGDQDGDGDNSLIAVALSDDPFLGNNASLVATQVVAAFSEGPTQMLSVAGADVATGDFNGDGYTDLVATLSDTVVYFNSGNRTLKTPGSSLGSGSGGSAVAVLDWNGDGNADIAVAGQAARAGRIYLGDGGGSFPDNIDINLSNAGTITAAAGADFAQDGFEDLVLTGSAGSTLLRSTGGNGYAQTTIPAGAGLSVSTGDFNNDSFPDIVIVESTDRSVRVLRNSGDGRNFNAMRLQRGSVASATADDVNGDGRADLLLAVDGKDLEAPESKVLVQRSDGTFPSGQAVGATPLSRMLAGDVNGDAITDIVAINDAGVHQLYLGKPGGGFALDAEQIVSDGMHRGVLVDFNKDQSLDLILAGRDAGAIEIHANNGIGRLGLGDRMAPVVKLLGQATMTLPAGAQYVESGATAIDDIDGDLSAALQISGTVDTSVIGSYKVTYSARDRAGNTGSAVRTVQVGVNEGTGGSGGGFLSPLFLLLQLLLVAWLRGRRAR